MGTNYMWRIALPTGGWLDRRDDPLVHIGKGVSAGREIGLRFIWAQQPALVRATCARLHSEPIVTDGGDVWTGRGFLELLKDYQVDDLTMIGTWFS